MIKIYQIISTLLLITISFIPKQIDTRINLAIIGFAILIFPLFFKNVKEDFKRCNIATIFFILFLIACSLSTIFSIDLNRSIPRLLLYYAYFIVFTSIRSILPTHKSKELFIGCYLLVVIVLSFISLYHTLVLRYVNRVSEGVSFMWVYFGHNHLSALLLLAIPMSLYFLKKYWHKKYAPLLLLTAYFLLFTLFLTFSRASIISLVSTGTFGILFFRFIQKQKISSFLIIGFSILFLSFITISAKQVGVAKPDVLSSVRLVYWKTAIVNGLSHPLTGTGLDTYRHLAYNSSRSVLKTNYAHNFFLQILSDTGILGFLSSIYLIIYLLYKSFKKLSEKLKTHEGKLMLVIWIGLLASTLNSLVDFDWQLPAVFLVFWILAGLFYPRSPSR